MTRLDSKTKQTPILYFNKRVIREELYLQLTNYHTKRAIARIRSSANDLNIERGRYKIQSNGYRIYDRLCRFCCASDNKTQQILMDLEHLPFYEPILETEAHVLSTCPAYHHLRLGLSCDLKI